MNDKRQLQSMLPCAPGKRDYIHNEQQIVDHRPSKLLFSPTDNMRRWNRLLICDGVIDVDYLSMNGWLGRDGTLYSCRRRHHEKISALVGFEFEHELEDSGWIKLTECEWLLESHYIRMEPSSAQVDYIIQWHESNGFDKKYLMRFIG